MKKDKPVAFSRQGCSTLRYLLGGAIAGGILGMFGVNSVVENPTLVQNIGGFFVGDFIGGTLTLLAMALDYRRSS